MKKINSVKHTKIWGYEIWLYSPLKGSETTFEKSGEKNVGGPLVKIIKANQPLSIQVHPDDKLAKELENLPNGKSEAWYVLDCEQDSELIVGLENYDEEIIKHKLQDKTFGDLLKKVSVKKGEFYNIPAGVVHGVGAGVTVLEVQQPSDVTYRYFDYNRKQKNGEYRELHIEKAIKSQKNLNYELEPTSNDPLTYTNDIGTQQYFDKPSTLKHKSIVVDLTTFECFLGNKNDEVNINNKYAVISF